MKNQLRSFLLGFSSFLLVWWWLSVITDNRSLPSPFPTVKRMWELKDVLFLHAGASLMRIFVALTIAVLVGLPAGILLGKYSKANQLFGPLLYFLYPLPKVAFLPIFMIFFGLGNLSKILLIFSVISIQVIVSIRDGVNEIPGACYQVMDNYSPKIGPSIRYLIFPALIPSLISSLRVSVGISLASLFFAENYNTTYGLGYLILSAWSKMDYEQMLSGIVMIAMIGFFMFTVLDELERRFCRYW